MYTSAGTAATDKSSKRRVIEYKSIPEYVDPDFWMFSWFLPPDTIVKYNEIASLRARYASTKIQPTDRDWQG